MKQMNVFFISLILLILTSCSNGTKKHIPKSLNPDTPQKLVIFLDGTGNDQNSYTNISKLYHLVTLRDNQNIRTFYAEGVGTKFYGLGTGGGIGQDVRDAYLFLLENYKHERKDEIYIFGFSRGAYSARILSAILHIAGIPNLNKIKSKEAYVNKIYDTYKSKKNIRQRQKDIEELIKSKPVSIKIEFMGIWDTVEALGFPDYKEDFILPNERYADQLCNVKKAAHALSLDDNRARVFTPILLTNNYLIYECKKNDKREIEDIVDEVWFSGAHSDVGGGYKEGNISGISLNWMLKKIEPFDLVPKGTKVYADYAGKTHDPEKGVVWGLLYLRRNRNIAKYIETTGYNEGKLKIHQSVIDRLKELKILKYEEKVPEKLGEGHWINDKCFKETRFGWEYIEENDDFEIVDKNYKN